MYHIRFLPYKADLYVWMREATNQIKENSYLEYVLPCIDNGLCISMDPKSVLKSELGMYWMLKKGSFGLPNIYLGNKVN